MGCVARGARLSGRGEGLDVCGVGGSVLDLSFDARDMVKKSRILPPALESVGGRGRRGSDAKSERLWAARGLLYIWKDATYALLWRLSEYFTRWGSPASESVGGRGRRGSVAPRELARAKERSITHEIDVYAYEGEFDGLASGLKGQTGQSMSRLAVGVGFIRSREAFEPVDILNS